MFVKFFSRFGIHGYGIQIKILLSKHLFSWPVQRLPLQMSIFSSVSQNKVAEIQGEKNSGR